MRIGEYEKVINKIKTQNYLILAHCTPCTKKKAKKIVRLISKHYYKRKKFILLEFKSKRGLGGYKYFRGKRRPWLSLPWKKMKHPNKWWGSLRIGIVLHELAHAICDYDKRCKEDHCKNFIKTFDKLLVLYYRKIEKKI